MENYLGGRQSGWTTALGLAVLYVLLGRLGLLLSIPPGYATAVWPASGLALAFVLRYGSAMLPGIWLGAFFVHVWTALDLSDAAAFLASLQMPMLLGLSAALQAQLGALLIRRVGDVSNIPGNEAQVPLMMLLGGPVACLVNCSIGVAGLWALSRLPEGAGWFSWWTWWMGDCIGVLVFTPIAFGWLARPYALTGARRAVATLSPMLIFALVVGLYVLTSRSEHARQQEVLDQATLLASQRIETEIERYLTALSALEGLFISHPGVGAAEFRQFAERLQARLPGLYAVAWYGRSTAEQAPAPATYLRYQPGAPLAVSGPEETFEAAGSSAFMRAAASRLPTVSGRLRLKGDPEPGYQMLMLQALPSASATPGPLLGVAVLAVHSNALLDGALRGLEPGLTVRLADRSAAPGQQSVFGPEVLGTKQGGLRSTRAITVADQQWQLDYLASPGYLLAHRSWRAWAVLAGGLLLTALLGVVLLLMIGRTTRIERLVAQRTRELADNNTELNLREQEMSRMLDELTDSEARLRNAAAELSRSNQELEQFAYITSHDLQAPLRGVASFAQLLQQRKGEQLDEEGREFLAFIEQGCKQMQQLVRDLLNLSRVGRSSSQFEPRNLAETLAKAQAANAAEMAASGAEVHSGPLPEICADHGLLVQLFQNLIGNAIKFQRPGARPRAEVSVQREGEHWLIHITDNGIGIAEEELENVFAIFRRLHSQEEYEGTGIGLAICRKIAKHHGGEIHALPHTGGAHFVLRLPVQPQLRAA